MRFIRTVLIAFTLLVLAGCASAPPPTTYYLLRSDPVEGQGPVDARVRIGLGRIVVAPYLMGSKGHHDRDGSRRDPCGEPPPMGRARRPGLRWFLRKEIGEALGFEVGGGLTDIQDWDYRVDLFVGRMHGTMDGRAIMESIFVVRSSQAGEDPGEYRFTKSLPLPEEGYAGVVEAQRELARELAQLMASALRARTGATAQGF